MRIVVGVHYSPGSRGVQQRCQLGPEQPWRTRTSRDSHCSGRPRSPPQPCHCLQHHHCHHCLNFLILVTSFNILIVLTVFNILISLPPSLSLSSTSSCRPDSHDLQTPAQAPGMENGGHSLPDLTPGPPVIRYTLHCSVNCTSEKCQLSLLSCPSDGTVIGPDELPPPYEKTGGVPMVSCRYTLPSH